MSRAPPLDMFVSCLGKRRDHSGRHRQSPTFVPTKFLQNSCCIGRAWPNFPAFYRAFRKIPTKMFLWYRCCAALYGVDCLSVRASKAVSLSRARHLSAHLSHVSASGAIRATATANHRRLSQQNSYKTRGSLVELGRIFRHFI